MINIIPCSNDVRLVWILSEWMATVIFFLSLWSNNYNVLEENDYFCTLNGNIQFNVFLDSYLEKNETRLKKLFHELSMLDKTNP